MRGLISRAVAQGFQGSQERRVDSWRCRSRAEGREGRARWDCEFMHAVCGFGFGSTAGRRRGVMLVSGSVERSMTSREMAWLVS